MPAMVLRPIVKQLATTLRARTGQPLRRECWSAITVDGEWGFERLDDVGTPWVIEYKPGTGEAEQCSGFYGTLKAARSAVEHGYVKRPSHYRAEHAAGVHAEHPQPYDCPTCREVEIAQHRAAHS